MYGYKLARGHVTLSLLVVDWYSGTRFVQKFTCSYSFNMWYPPTSRFSVFGDKLPRRRADSLLNSGGESAICIVCVGKQDKPTRTLRTRAAVDSSVSIRAATISCTLVGADEALSVVFRAARDCSGYFGHEVVERLRSQENRKHTIAKSCLVYLCRR